MSHHLDQSAKDCIVACNDCAIECGNCFALMIGKESMNARLAASSARRFAGCVPMRWPAIVGSPSRPASYARTFATVARHNATRMTWTTVSAAPRRAAVAPMPAARWSTNQCKFKWSHSIISRRPPLLLPEPLRPEVGSHSGPTLMLMNTFCQYAARAQRHLRVVSQHVI